MLLHVFFYFTSYSVTPCSVLYCDVIDMGSCIFAARCYASAAYDVMRCPCVCPFVTFVNSVKTNKHIFKICSPSASHSILVFRTKRHGNTPTATLLTWASNAGGLGRNGNYEPVSGFTACCQHCDRPGVINTSPTDHGTVRQVVTLIAGSKRRSLLMVAGDDDEMFMARSFNVTPKTTEQHLITHSVTHSLTAALDQLRIVASSTSNDPGSRSEQHQQIRQCLLPLVAANFFVDDPAGASSQLREEC